MTESPLHAALGVLASRTPSSPRGFGAIRVCCSLGNVRGRNFVTVQAGHAWFQSGTSWTSTAIRTSQQRTAAPRLACRWCGSARSRPAPYPARLWRWERSCSRRSGRAALGLRLAATSPGAVHCPPFPRFPAFYGRASGWAGFRSDAVGHRAGARLGVPDREWEPSSGTICSRSPFEAFLVIDGADVDFDESVDETSASSLRRVGL